MQSIGWIGTGIMGSSICKNLLAADYEVRVVTRTRAKAEPLLAQGALWVDSPRELAEACDLVVTMVGFPHEVREVYLGEGGLVAHARSGSVLVDMTTSTPSLAREIHAAAGARDVASLDAPVSGGDRGAREATLSIMVGGDAATFERVRPMFETIGKKIVLQGGAGSGQHTKMVNQILIASNMVGVAEAMVYGRQAGLDLETVLESVSDGAAGSWSLSNLAPRMLRDDFAPGFMVEHFIKDMEIALDEAHAMGLATPGLALARELYASLSAQGSGRDGTQALVRAAARLSGTEW